MRIASPYVGCEEEQLRRKDIDNKRLWLNGKDFKTSFGKRSTNNDMKFIKNYVTADPSPPPLLHKFREEDKNMWVKGPFKY